MREALGLERNIIVMLGSTLALGLGEELWSRFMPRYLETLGASVWVVALYGTLKDFLDAIYQYPGGWIADRVGRRGSLAIFLCIASVGYTLYLLGTGWTSVIIGTVFVMAWSSLTLPDLFAIIGDNLPQSRRAVGFGVQSILKRIPIVLAPPLGGILIAAFGFAGGLHLGFALTAFLSLAAAGAALLFYRENNLPAAEQIGMGRLWSGLDPRLKRLLVSDCLARWAEGIPKVFIVLYVMDTLGVRAFDFGWLTSVQQLTAIALSIPIARLSDKLNRKPFIIATFAFFALFPLALVQARGTPWLCAAFIVGGMREFGEPARKSLIVDLARATARGRTVGIYYLLRGLAVFPASIAGAWLWKVDARLMFYAAFAVGAAGCAAFLWLGDRDTTNNALTAGKGGSS